MSTKVTIKSHLGTTEEPEFHVHDDALDHLAPEAADAEPPVYLCLKGVDVELRTLPGGRAEVTVKMPRGTARAPGILVRP